MSYGVALRNGVPFTLGTIAALCVNATTQWNPLRLWPDGIASPGMWISPRDLTSQWQDYTGTTPVVTPGTVADSANPVGLALDIRAGATVLTDPGNHMLQSTSAARPLMSARVNLLPSSESLAWMRNPLSNIVFTTGQADPFGGTDAVLLTADTADMVHGLDSIGVPLGASGEKGLSFYAKPSGVRYLFVCIGSMQWTETYLVGACFDLSGSGAVISTGAWTDSASITLTPSGFYLCEFQSNQSSSDGPAFSLSHSSTLTAFVGNGTDGIVLSKYDCRLGAAASTAAEYQRVTTSSDYATDFPIYQKYDGVDDGMATAAFSAGTLTSAMDCMIAVRRDSSGQMILGPYNAVGDLSKYLGNADGSYNSVCYNGAGSPTVWVDNVQLTHGWASELNTAVTVGDWHIIEFRNLDLSSWTGLGAGGIGGGISLNGARGDIMLFPSTASTEDKDAARQYLADYYGVTLP